jgi:hypothetical protein
MGVFGYVLGRPGTRFWDKCAGGGFAQVLGGFCRHRLSQRWEEVG